MGPISWIACTFSYSTLWWQLAMNHLKSWAPYLHAPRHHPTPNTVIISYHCLYHHSLLVTTVAAGFKPFYLESWLNYFYKLCHCCLCQGPKHCRFLIDAKIVRFRSKLGPFLLSVTNMRAWTNALTHNRIST